MKAKSRFVASPYRQKKIITVHSFGLIPRTKAFVRWAWGEAERNSALRQRRWIVPQSVHTCHCQWFTSLNLWLLKTGEQMNICIYLRGLYHRIPEGKWDSGNETWLILMWEACSAMEIKFGALGIASYFSSWIKLEVAEAFVKYSL